MKAYIYQGQILTYAQEVTHVEVSTAYPSNDHVALSDEQLAFYENNPCANVDEVFNMMLNQPLHPTNEQLRAQEYEAVTNRLIPIWIQSRELGQLEQYEAEHAEWLRLVEEIKLKYPI